jgi:hypothetical protein
VESWLQGAACRCGLTRGCIAFGSSRAGDPPTIRRLAAKQRANDMKASTPLERQIYRLSRYQGRSFRVAIVLLWIAPIVVVTLGVMNLNGAATHAKLANTSLTGVLKLWLNGPLPEATYSGHVVLALERIDDAVFQFTEAPIALIVLVVLRGRRKSAQELLALLKAHSA